MMATVGISGASCSGKTSIAKMLAQHFSNATILHQDDFYKEENLLDAADIDWEVPEALDCTRLLDSVRGVSAQHPLCLLLIEGTMILDISGLKPLLDLTFFITGDFDRCLERRKARTDLWKEYPDPPGYFESRVWPSYLKQKEELDSSTIVVDGTVDVLDKISEFIVPIEKIIQHKKQSSKSTIFVIQK